MSNVNVTALLRRLDDHAHEQLCNEVARLADENDRLLGELRYLEDCADGWREETMNLHEQLAASNGGARGITVTGKLVVAHAASPLDVGK